MQEMQMCQDSVQNTQKTKGLFKPPSLNNFLENAQSLVNNGQTKQSDYISVRPQELLCFCLQQNMARLHCSCQTLDHCHAALKDSYKPLPLHYLWQS